MLKIILPILLITFSAPIIAMKKELIPLADLSRKIPIPKHISQKTIEQGKANWTIADLDNAACGFISMEYAIGMYTPIHQAVLNKNTQRVKFFIDHPELKKNKTVLLNEVLDLAVHSQDLPTINGIIALGADPLQWLLHNPSTRINPKVLNVLTSHILKQTLPNQGYTVPNSQLIQSSNPLDDELDSAIKNNDIDTVLLLIGNGADFVKWLTKNKKTIVSPQMFKVWQILHGISS